MLISLIAAMSRNRVIGAMGQIPWRLPGDLQRFKQLTIGQTLLMGRKTFETIGRPLPGRQTIVLSRNPNYRPVGVRVVSDLPAGLAAAASDELFICGGGEIYRQALPLAERIYLTELPQVVEGDTFFPEIPAEQFKIIRSLQLVESAGSYRFFILQR